MDVPSQIETPLRAVNPAVRLVRARHLRRAQWELLDTGELAVAVPDAPLRIARQRAADLDVLPASVTAGHDPELLLLSEPADRDIAHRSPGEILRLYWESLFAHAVTEQCRAAVGETGANGRWEKLGPVVRAEAAFLLAAEHRVSADPSAEELYGAFAAEFARVLFFRPSALHEVFPAVDPAAARAVIESDADLAVLLKANRPRGTDDPRDVPLAHFPPPPAKPHERPHRAAGYARAADGAATVGNHARAAILHQKAVLASSAGAARHYKAARDTLAEQLVPRLAAVLDWDADTRAAWAVALQPLLTPAAIGTWPAGAKALYDLQSVASELERDIYAVDPPSWFRSFGQRPMVRKLTLGRQVILLLHLKRVQRHLADTPLPEANRQELARLLGTEIAVVDATVRGEIGPKMVAAFDAVGFVPTGPAETVARDKIVQELLDIACERGQVRLGHLRDAIARNRLKLPDLSGPVEFLAGDALLRADAELDRQLDGVYVRGEAYLRAIQRGSAVAFGTRTGRALCAYLLGPVIAAFLTVVFAQYVAEELGKVAKFVRSLVRYQDDVILSMDEDGSINLDWLSELQTPEKHGIEIGPGALTAVAVLSVFFLLLIHWPRFRALVGAGLGGLWRGVVRLIGLPFRAWRWEPARAARRHPAYRWVARRLGLALFVGGGLALFLWLFGASSGRILRFAGFAFATVALFVNSLPGRWFTEETAEVLSDTWRRVRVNLLPNLFGWIVWLFRELLAALDRLLYAVDEWLRFRGGQSKPNLWLKVAIGVVWFPIAYLFRFVIYLFIEPQINPVKHFPVVTVSHKLLLPLIPTLAPTVETAMGVSYDKALGLLTVVIGCIPGMFGFIAWELKENWRLYAASRPKRLGAVSLGHHGESMRGLLRPGFHSGTVPALFKKIRAAIRNAVKSGTPATVGKPLDGLHHVEHAIQLFLERELVAPLKAVGLHLHAGHVHLGLQSVAAEVLRDGDPRPAVFQFTHSRGAISGGVTDAGFAADLSGTEREAWDRAVLGVLAMAAVPTDEADTRTTWAEWDAFWKRVG